MSIQPTPSEYNGDDLRAFEAAAELLPAIVAAFGDDTELTITGLAMRLNVPVSALADVLALFGTGSDGMTPITGPTVYRADLEAEAAAWTEET